MKDQLTDEYRPSEDEPYMCPQHLEFFRQKLLQWRRQLMQESQGTLERMREEKTREADMVDQGLLEADLAFNLKSRERCRNLLVKVDSALVRIEEGTYGYCEETGEEIGLRRLVASPLATLSIEAQERLERLMKQQGVQERR